MGADGPLGGLGLRHPGWERFAREYVVDHNGAAAAVRAGYAAGRAKQTARDLLRRPEVAARVAELDKEKADALGITAASTIADLVAIKDRALRGTVRTYRNGPALDEHDRPVYVPDLPTALRAVEMIAKLAGVGAPTIPEVDVSFVFRLELGASLDDVGVGGGYDLDEPRSLP